MITTVKKITRLGSKSMCNCIKNHAEWARRQNHHRAISFSILYFYTDQYYDLVIKYTFHGEKGQKRLAYKYSAAPGPHLLT